MSLRSPKKKRYWLAGDREHGQDAFFLEALDPSVWTKGNADNWDTCWYTGMPDSDVLEQLEPGKTVNHIPGNNHVTVKSYLHETLSIARDRVAGRFDSDRMNFFPHIYQMPDDYHDLQAAAAADPEKGWILKPINSSRGRGIEVISDVATAPLGEDWMVQDYLDHPLIIKERKHVLRLYVLFTSVEPLRVYLYKEGSAKFASEPYDPGDTDNVFSHLTNPDINALNEEADVPVIFISLKEYRGLLRAEGHDDQKLFSEIQDLVRLTSIAVRDHMRTRTRAIDADTSGCYELIGLDCMIDANLKPWLLECNLSPTLDVCTTPEDGGDVEERMKRQLVADMVQIMGLNDPVKDLSGLSAYERIKTDAEREFASAGDFERMYPCEDLQNYLSFFPVPRYADIVLAEMVTGSAPKPPTLSAGRTQEIVTDDALLLYSQENGTIYTPNPSAAWIWLMVTDGATPDQIADELIAANKSSGEPSSEADNWAVRENVWDVLAEWANLGLLINAEQTVAPDAAETSNMADIWHGEDHVSIGNTIVTLKYGCPYAALRLRQVLKPLFVKNKGEHSFQILKGPSGYAVVHGAHLVGAGFNLSEVVPSICQRLFELAPTSANEIALQAALVPLDQENAVLVISAYDGGFDILAHAMATSIGLGQAGGVLLQTNEHATAVPVNLPLRLSKEDIEETGVVLDKKTLQQLQELSEGTDGYLLPSTLEMKTKSYAISAVILPKLVPESETSVTPLKANEVLSGLLPLTFAMGAKGLSGEQVSAFAAWLAERPLVGMAFSDPEEAARAAIELVERQ